MESSDGPPTSDQRIGSPEGRRISSGELKALRPRCTRVMSNGEAERPAAIVQQALRAHTLSLCSQRSPSYASRPLQRLLAVIVTELGPIYPGHGRHSWCMCRLDVWCYLRQRGSGRRMTRWCPKNVFAVLQRRKEEFCNRQTSLGSTRMHRRFRHSERDLRTL